MVLRVWWPMVWHVPRKFHAQSSSCRNQLLSLPDFDALRPIPRTMHSPSVLCLLFSHHHFVVPVGSPFVISVLCFPSSLSSLLNFHPLWITHCGVWKLSPQNNCMPLSVIAWTGPLTHSFALSRRICTPRALCPSPPSHVCFPDV